MLATTMMGERRPATKGGVSRIGRLRASAAACMDEGRYRDAEPLMRQALTIAEQVHGRDHLEVATILNDLAVVFKYLGRFAEAGPLYQRALAITQKALGPDHTEVATIYHNLGGLEHSAGNFSRGEPFARRAVKIRTRALGPEHPDVAADLAALAALLDGQKKYPEAERLYGRALDIFERHYGPEHYEIAVNLNNLAAIYQAQRKTTDAERLYRCALAIKEKLLGPDHPDVAMSLNNLAVLCKRQKRFTEARPLYRRALAIFERALGPEHPNVATCLENYAQLLRKLGRKTEAARREARAEKIWSGLDRLNEKDMAVTATVDPEIASFRLAVRPSTVHRWGVFAEERIPPQRKVIEYTGERIGRYEMQRRASDYLFRLNDGRFIDGAVGGSGAEYINHSCDPNLRSQFAKGHILYVSKRHIEPGEELTVDYQFSPYAPKAPCHCGSPHCRGTINVSKKSYTLLRRKWKRQAATTRRWI